MGMAWQVPAGTRQHPPGAEASDPDARGVERVMRSEASWYSMTVSVPVTAAARHGVAPGGSGRLGCRRDSEQGHPRHRHDARQRHVPGPRRLRHRHCRSSAWSTAGSGSCPAARRPAARVWAWSGSSWPGSNRIRYRRSTGEGGTLALERVLQGGDVGPADVEAEGGEKRGEDVRSRRCRGGRAGPRPPQTAIPLPVSPSRAS